MNTQIIKLLLEEIEIRQKTIDALNGELTRLKSDGIRFPAPILKWEAEKLENPNPVKHNPSTLVDAVMLAITEHGRFIRYRQIRHFLASIKYNDFSTYSVSTTINRLSREGSIIKEINKGGSKVAWGLPVWKDRNGKVVSGRESDFNKWDIKMWDEK